MKKIIILALALITGNLFCLEAQNSVDLGASTNRWSLHTSTNGAQEFYIVPLGSSWWDWSKATIFKTNGDIVARRNLSVNGGKVFTKGITGASTEKLLLEGYSYQGTQHGLLLRAPEEGINFETYDAGTWRSRLFIADNGNIGIGTTNPNSKLEVKSEGGEQNQGQIHVVGNGGNGTGDAYISFYEGTETNSQWSVGVKDNDNAFSISSGLTMDASPKFTISESTGNVGIGVVNTPDYKLAVKGKIIAEELKVALHGNWPDYVFKSNYNLPSLVEVENHIKEKGHLKDIPSEKEVKENGIMVGEMNAMLLRKIEELTLYVIKQQKQIDILNAERLKEKR